MEKTISKEQYMNMTAEVLSEMTDELNAKGEGSGMSSIIALMLSTVLFSKLREKIFGKEEKENNEPKEEQ